MLLAVYEIKRNKLKFSLVTMILALIVFLLILLSALGNGLIVGLAGALQHFNADFFIYEKDANLNIQRSNISQGTLKDITAVSGVATATPLKFSIVSMDVQGETVDIALLGIENSAVTKPILKDGQYASSDFSTVVDESILGKGVKLGDRVKIKDTDKYVTVKGITSERKLSMMPTFYVNLNTFNEINKAAMSRQSPGQVMNFNGSNLVLVKAKEGTSADQLKKDLENKVKDIQVTTKKDGVSGFQGMGPMEMVVRALQVFSFAIGIAVTGVFFYILTIQKTSQFGAIKAMGATNGYLIKDLISQVTILTVIGVLVGVLMAMLSITMIPPTISMTPDLMGIFYSVIGVYLMSIVGSIFSARHIFKIDPGIALGQAQ